MEFSAIDKNFAIKTELYRDDIAFFDAESEPFRIYGVKKENGIFRRMPQSVANAVSEGVSYLHELTSGGRVRFITDSPYVAIYTVQHRLSKMPHFSFIGCNAFDLYSDGKFVNSFRPPLDMTDHYEDDNDLPDPGKEHEITIHFPLYAGVIKLYIGLKEGSTLKPASDYAVEKPVVYYGSSITQGACACRPGTAYPAIIARTLSCNFSNLGFAGCAKGEPEMAEYIAGLDMSAFVYDYDHNADSPEHLKETHETMFQTIRRAHPDLPILMLSMIYGQRNDDIEERLQVIKQTYQNAIDSGDKYVWFIDGRDLFTEELRNDAMADLCHPNDSGFLMMADAIGKVLQKMLSICTS